jgi:hypothetical protein
MGRSELARHPVASLGPRHLAVALPPVASLAQFIASFPADRAKTIATVRALVNEHISRGSDECLVRGTAGRSPGLDVRRLTTGSSPNKVGFRGVFVRCPEGAERRLRVAALLRKE